MGRRSLLNANPGNTIDQLLSHSEGNITENNNDSADFGEIEEILSFELKKRLSLSSDEELQDQIVDSFPTTSTETRVFGDSPTEVDDRENSLFNPKYLDTAGAFRNVATTAGVNPYDTGIGPAEIPFDPLLPIEIGGSGIGIGTSAEEAGNRDNVPLSKVSTNEMFPIDWSYQSPTTKGSMWSYENNSGYAVSRENSNDLFTFDNVTTIFGLEPQGTTGGSAITAAAREAAQTKTQSPSGTSPKPRKSIFSNIFEENSSSSACTEEGKPEDVRPHTEPSQTILTMENTLNVPNAAFTNPACFTHGFNPQVLTAPATAPELYQNMPEFMHPMNCMNVNAFSFPPPQPQTQPQPQPQPQPPLNGFYNINGVERFVPVPYSTNQFSRHSSISYEPTAAVATTLAFNKLSQKDIQRNYETVVRYFGEPTPAELDIKNYYKHLDNNLLPKLTYPIEMQGDSTEYRLIACCFKNSRLDVFYISHDNKDNLKNLKVGDLVIVEADRGKDLGKVVKMNVSVLEARLLRYAQYLGRNAAAADDTSLSSHKRPVLNFPKLVLRVAKDEELLTIDSKIADEVNATEFCQAKIKEYGLQLSVVDAEYQWDMKKLTFYYLSDLRIDFRDLVKDLFRTYKIRIWMSKKS